MELVALALLLSLDNLRLAAVLGLLDAARRHWCRLAIAMAAVEAGFPLLGTLAASELRVAAASLERAGPFVLLAAAALSFAGVLGTRALPAGPVLFALPALFGLDNLVAGAALASVGLPALGAALLVGAGSGAASLATMLVVGSLGRRLRRRRAWAPACVALALGASALVLP